MLGEGVRWRTERVRQDGLKQKTIVGLTGEVREVQYIRENTKDALQICFTLNTLV